MTRLLPVLLLFLGCDPIADTTAIRTCDAEDPSIDCCRDGDECVAYFGPSFSFCTTPGRETGRCVECTTDAHCDNDSFCVLDSPTGPFCGPLGDDR